MASPRIPGRKLTASQRAEVLRVWDALDDDRRKLILIVVRAMAKDAGISDGDILPAPEPGPGTRTGR
ncbi:hypothetical protein [Roseomonas xinghualingensis]|uniref:hypothetical protein n=1 Tax=Roseomonas xinghualingensis TaxID=2986475 RepID=UPI0021F21565|nr:hypothetical protein [Roseomonas sp. SXEYE001]MCV4208577.1 hypothetical protein [Roseomonas sp. SXEYE001]